jgi:hemerythrin-like domain-containing protein
MKTTEVLVKEHGLILQVLDFLSMARQKLENGEMPPKEIFEKSVLFSVNFSDKFHHYKEEYLLFGLLAQKKEGALDLEIGALRYQHERCRHFIAEINNAVDGYASGNEIIITTLLENLASYISLLRRHIHMEDHIFFKMAGEVLSQDEDRALLGQFENEDKRIGGNDFYENHKKLAGEIGSIIQENRNHP